jgi:hypothetical protein
VLRKGTSTIYGLDGCGIDDGGPLLFLWYGAGSASTNLCPLLSLLRTDIDNDWLLVTIKYQ